MSGPIFDITVDYYAALGVGKSATEEEIRDAYRRLAKRLHPDVNPNNPHATEHFKQLEKAYAVLKNVLIRRDYDNARSAHLNPQPEPVAAAAEQCFNCPHCQTPNVMPLEGLTIQSLCGNCHQPLLGMPTQSPRHSAPIYTANAPRETFTGTSISARRRSKSTSGSGIILLGCTAMAFVASFLFCSGFFSDSASLPNSSGDRGDKRTSTSRVSLPLPEPPITPIARNEILGAWVVEWNIDEAGIKRGEVRWNLQLHDSGEFYADMDAFLWSGESSQDPLQQGQWLLDGNQLSFSIPVSIPATASTSEHVRVIHIQQHAQDGIAFTYRNGQEPLRLRRAVGSPRFHFEANRAGSIFLEPNGSRLWSYIMHFNLQQGRVDEGEIELASTSAYRATGSTVEFVTSGLEGGAARLQGGVISVDTGLLADQEDWTLSLCFKPESLAVESILYGEMDKAGSDLFDIILSRDGHVYLAVWNEGHKPEPWQKTLLTTKRCEVGKWAGLLLTRRDGKVYGHVNQDSVNIDMQVSSRRSSQTDIGRKFQGVIDEVYVAGHRMSSDAYAELPARTLGPQ